MKVSCRKFSTAAIDSKNEWINFVKVAVEKKGLKDKEIIIKFWSKFYEENFVPSTVEKKSSATLYKDEVERILTKFKEEESKPYVNQSQMYEGASKKSLRMSNDFLRISIVLFMLLFFYLAFLLIGIDFNLVIMKLQSMLLGKSLHFLFSRLGWGGLIVLAFLFFDPETMGKMMDPSGASGSGSGEGRGFRWTDLFGSSSTGSSETSVAPDPTSTHPGEPAAPIAEVYLPLQEDGQRRLELSHRLSINTIRHPLPDSLFDDIIETQFRTELQIEKALRSDRVQEDDFLDKRHQIRGVLFYPNGRAFSLEAYKDHLNQIDTYGTHRSLPYRRLMSAIHNFDLDLDFAKIKRNR